MDIKKISQAVVMAAVISLASWPAMAEEIRPPAAAIPPAVEGSITLPAEAEVPAEVQTLSLDEAIKLTLANNIDLQLVEKQVDARTLDLDRADYFSDKLRDADEKINDGWQTLRTSESQLASVKAGISAGIITSASPYYLTPTQITAMEGQIQAAESELQANAKYQIDNLGNAQVVELYQTKAGLGLSVTELGCRIAREKYALLTKQKYYEVLKAQRLMAVKKAAAARAKTQAKMAEDSYQVGFRAKDDLLMAQAQLSLIQADLRKTENDLALAILDLKKVMYIPLATEIKLVDDFNTDKLTVDLNQGLARALSNRLEIKKSEMEVTVAQINMELAKRYLAPNVFDYRQIQLDLLNAQLVRIQQQQVVEGDVRASYNNVLATTAMLEQVTKSVSQARQALQIVTYRYQEGYGIPTSVLKSLHMEDAAGTIFEVVAAEEKLSEVEEKVVEITAAYHLARSKYAVDICSENLDDHPDMN